MEKCNARDLDDGIWGCPCGTCKGLCAEMTALAKETMPPEPALPGPASLKVEVASREPGKAWKRRIVLRSKLEKALEKLAEKGAEVHVRDADDSARVGAVAL